MTNYICDHCGRVTKQEINATEKKMTVDCAECGVYKINFDPAQFQVKLIK